MSQNEPKDGEAKPYLELSEEIPEPWRVAEADVHPIAEPPSGNSNPLLGVANLPINPASPLLRDQTQARRAGLRSWWGQLNTVPRGLLIALSVSVLIILALMPQFLLILFGVLRQVVLILRVLALPVAAVLVTLWILRLFYPRNRR